MKSVLRRPAPPTSSSHRVPDAQEESVIDRKRCCPLVNASLIAIQSFLSLNVVLLPRQSFTEVMTAFTSTTAATITRPFTLGRGGHFFFSTCILRAFMNWFAQSEFRENFGWFYSFNHELLQLFIYKVTNAQLSANHPVLTRLARLAHLLVHTETFYVHMDTWIWPFTQKEAGAMWLDGGTNSFSCILHISGDI